MGKEVGRKKSLMLSFLFERRQTEKAKHEYDGSEGEKTGKGIKMFATDAIKFVQGHLLGSTMLVCHNIIMTISHICLARHTSQICLCSQDGEHRISFPVLAREH